MDRKLNFMIAVRWFYGWIKRILTLWINKGWDAFTSRMMDGWTDEYNVDGRIDSYMYEYQIGLFYIFGRCNKHLWFDADIVTVTLVITVLSIILSITAA